VWLLSDASFDVRELDEMATNMLILANRKSPKEYNKFLRKEGSKLARKTKQKARRKVGKKEDIYHKSIKRGKPYRYNSQERAIRVYSSAPHAHLIEDGHRQVANGVEVGFVRGRNVFSDAKEEFEETFISDAEDFVVKLLEEGF
jgi:hypothetical protein